MLKPTDLQFLRLSGDPTMKVSYLKVRQDKKMSTEIISDICRQRYLIKGY